MVITLDGGLPIEANGSEVEESTVARNRLLRLAATAEQGSEHPLANAVLRAAKMRGLKVHSIAEAGAEIFPGGHLSAPSGLEEHIYTHGTAE